MFVKRIAHQIKVQKRSYDRILAIGRGGLIPGVLLSHKLKTEMMVIMAKNFLYYNKENPVDRVILSQIANIINTGNFLDKKRMDYVTLVKEIKEGKKTLQSERIKKVLVVDEIVDSGKSLVEVLDVCKLAGWNCHVAVLIEKPQKLVKIDYSGDVLDKNIWAKFVWESENENV